MTPNMSITLIILTNQNAVYLSGRGSIIIYIHNRVLPSCPEIIWHKPHMAILHLWISVYVPSGLLDKGLEMAPTDYECTYTGICRRILVRIVSSTLILCLPKVASHFVDDITGNSSGIPWSLCGKIAITSSILTAKVKFDIYVDS